MRRPPSTRVTAIRRAFGVPAALLRTTGSRDEHGEWITAESRMEVVLSTVPLASAGNDARARRLEEGGIRLADVRLVYSAETLTPAAEDSPGDIVEHGGERYRVREVAHWDGFDEAVVVRIEPQ